MLPWQTPYLQEMHRLRLVLILLCMRDAAATSGELDVSAFHDEIVIATNVFQTFRVRLGFLAVHRVAVCQLPRKDIAEDLGITMRMRRETSSGSDAVFVEYA